MAQQTASYVLFVGNGSPLCGVSWDCLYSTFVKFGEIDDIRAFPTGRPYSFVSFVEQKSAVAAFEALQFNKPDGLPDKNIVLFMAYLVKMPPVESKLCANSNRPSGLSVLEGFVTADEERDLVQFFDSYSETLLSKGCESFSTETGSTLKNRKVFHFGYEFVYGTNAVNISEPHAPPIPDCCVNLIDRIIEVCRTVGVKSRPDQLTVNIYEPGQGIPSHVDTHSAFEEAILSLSLCSNVAMEFKDCSDLNSVAAVVLPARSLAVMTDSVRYAWKHGIASRTYDCDPTSNRLMRRGKRISLTFRAVRRLPCSCAFPEFCDAPRGDEIGALSNPCGLERKYVGEVYEAIADHFDETRQSQWKAIRLFLQSLTEGCLLLDCGCGNGKYLTDDDHNGLVKFGCDLSENLCRIARTKCYNVIQADCLRLPYRDQSFDAVISVAVIHHLSTEARRLQAVSEILRVLKTGGRAMITVWAFEQNFDGADSEYLKWGKAKESAGAVGGEQHASNGGGLRPLRVHVSNTPFAERDMLVPWVNKCRPGEQRQQNNSKRYLRYYHLFEESELASLCQRTGCCTVLRDFHEQGNWIAELMKT